MPIIINTEIQPLRRIRKDSIWWPNSTPNKCSKTNNMITCMTISTWRTWLSSRPHPCISKINQIRTPPQIRITSTVAQRPGVWCSATQAPWSPNTLKCSSTLTNSSSTKTCKTKSQRRRTCTVAPPASTRTRWEPASHLGRTSSTTRWNSKTRTL